MVDPQRHEEVSEISVQCGWADESPQMVISSDCTAANCAQAEQWEQCSSVTPVPPLKAVSRRHPELIVPFPDNSSFHPFCESSPRAVQMTLNRSYWQLKHLRHFINVSLLQIEQSHNLLLGLGKPPNDLLCFKLRNHLN